MERQAQRSQPLIQSQNKADSNRQDGIDLDDGGEKKEKTEKVLFRSVQARCLGLKTDSRYAFPSRSR